MTRYAYAERLALADRMACAGPDHPTLCGDWTVRDLLAHLLVRERRPDAALGILIKPLAARTGHAQDGIAAGEFEVLLRRLRHPPWWSPVSNPLTDEIFNLAEMFVHHEDVRRAGAGWRPRELAPGLQAALWKHLRARAWLALRRFRATIRIEAPGFGAIRAGAGGPEAVTLTGNPGELMLFLFGRQAHAQVGLDGPQEVTERLRRARLGV